MQKFTGLHCYLIKSYNLEIGEAHVGLCGNPLHLVNPIFECLLHVFDLQFPKGSDKPKPIWNGPQAPATFHFQIAEFDHGFFLHPPLL